MASVHPQPDWEADVINPHLSRPAGVVHIHAEGAAVELVDSCVPIVMRFASRSGDLEEIGRMAKEAIEKEVKRCYASDILYSRDRILDIMVRPKVRTAARRRP